MNTSLQDRLEKLSPQQRERILQKLRSQQAQAAQALENKITPLSKEHTQRIPLSFAQARLWFLYQQMDEKNAAYNVPLFLQLKGQLDCEALKAALDALIERHAVLRTQFEMSDEAGEVVQVILDTIDYAMLVIDLQHLPANERLAQAQRFAKQEMQKPFDLEHAPLLRVNLLKLADEQYVFSLVMPHIITDGWSVSILSDELSVLYRAFCQQQSSPLKPLELQYADYAFWQRQWLSSERLQQHTAYWKQQLADTPALLELPTDYPRPALMTYNGQSEFFSLDAETTAQLKQLSQQSGCTLFMTLLAAFNVLLARYSGQNDISIGSPIANRHRHEIEPLIGFFVNTLVLRNQLDMQADFSELLSLVKRTTLEAYAHQDMPFEKMVDELNPVRSLSHNPLFQVMFVMQNMPVKTLDLPGLQVERLDYENTSAQFDLTLAVKETPQGLDMAWEYNTALFDTTSIQRMTSHFAVLLKAIVDNPTQPVSRLSMLTEQDIQQLQNWNKTTAYYPIEQTVVDLFERQVDKTPDNIAVVFEDQPLSYRELNLKANQLAHYLLKKGSLGNRLIAIVVERSLKMVIGLLGILKAGAAYVPIDPTYPSARIRYMLSDSATSLLLTQSHLKAKLVELKHDAVVVCLDEVNLVIQPTENPSVRKRAKDLAYVIYTSGSTGQPKGVMIEHQALALHSRAILQQYMPNENDRVLQFASFSFDASLEQFLMAWLSGACSVLLKSNLITAQDLLSILKKQAITIVDLPPAYWQKLLEIAPMASVLPALRILILGGEAFPLSLAQHTRQYFPALTCFNAYGPTEAVITATLYRLPAILSNNTKYISIGRPRINTRIYILDAQHQVIPPGIPGELCIAGEALAQGYLNRAELMREKFIEIDLFGKTERIYKTGDLARWLPDGHLDYLGRIDHQIQLRGFRIELGEIESVLKTLPSVREAIVMVQKKTKGDQQLIAYLTTQAKQTLAPASKIKQSLQEHLPGYMIPAHFIPLESLPIMANGKLDRNALPAPENIPHQATKEIIAPRTTLELELLQIWEKILNVYPISVNDNFFELGGHSLLAVSLISRIEREMGKKIPLTLFFQEGSIAQQAAFLEKNNPASNWSTLVPLKSHGSKPPFFCVHPGGGTIIWYRHLARHFSPEQPFYALESQGLEEGQEPFDQVEQMASYYIQAIQTVQAEGPYFIGGWCFGGVVAFEMAQQLRTMGQEIAFLGLIDTPMTSKLPDGYKNDVSFFVRLLKRNVPHLPEYQKQIQHLDEEEQLKQLIEQTKIVEKLPADFGLQQAKRMMSVFRGHIIAGSTYQPKPYLGKTTFLQASEGDAAQGDETLGWHDVTQSNMKVYWIPGDHMNMVVEPNVQQLAEKLDQCFAQATMLYKQPKPERISVNADKYKLIGTRNHSRKAVATAAIKKGEVINVFDLTPQPQDYLTVQLDVDLHIMDDLLASMNHSCSPSAYIDVTNQQVIATRDLKAGDEITFFYPSTEWVMVQPFECHCGSLNCCQMIKGARDMPTDVMNNYHLSPYIRQQLEAQAKK